MFNSGDAFVFSLLYKNKNLKMAENRRHDSFFNRRNIFDAVYSTVPLWR